MWHGAGVCGVRGAHNGINERTASCDVIDRHNRQTHEVATKQELIVIRL